MISWLKRWRGRATELPDMKVTPRWWWSHTRKYLWECEESRRFHQYLWELSDHGHNPIHLATIVNSRHVPDWVES